MLSAGGRPGAIVRLGFLLLFWRSAASQEQQAASQEGQLLPFFLQPADSSSSSSTGISRFPDLTIPRDPIFDDPWVQHNIAVVYAHQVQDGVGSQTMRMIAVYALSTAAGIRHLFRPLGCVGHIGGHVHYRETDCNFTQAADIRQLRKAQHLIQLPSTVTEQETVSWDKKFLGSLDWTPFVKDVRTAAINKRPTLFEVERINGIIRRYPDIFMTIPALRPSDPPAPLSCRQPDRQKQSGGISHSKAWLLDALRVAIHVRRGDVITDGWVKRVLDTNYYINLARTLGNVLEPLGCDYSMEVYIEAPQTPGGVRELKLLKDKIPNAVLLVHTDMLWTWQMMATADILVMSNSMFSLSAGLMNPNAVAIHVPFRHYTSRPGMFRLKHWLAPLDESGVLPGVAIEEIMKRAGYQPLQQQQQQQQLV